MYLYGQAIQTIWNKMFIAPDTGVLRPLEERINILDFCIKAFRNEMCVLPITDPIYGQISHSPSRIPFICSTGRQTINLSEVFVAAFPSSAEKLSDAIQDVCTNVYVEPNDEVEVDYYPELNLAVVLNGHHYLAVAGGLKQGVVTANVLPLSECFDLLKISVYGDELNPIQYRWQMGNQTDYITDHRLAVLYTLLQAKNKLQNILRISAGILPHSCGR